MTVPTIPTESAAYRVVTPSQAFTRKISRLFVSVAILRTEPHSMLPPEGKRVTGFSVAYVSLQHGYQRLTMICASLRSFATAVTDSRQFARRYAPSNCVRWCNSCSLPPWRGSQVTSLRRSRWVSILSPQISILKNRQPKLPVFITGRFLFFLSVLPAGSACFSYGWYGPSPSCAGLSSQGW